MHIIAYLFYLYYNKHMENHRRRGITVHKKHKIAEDDKKFLARLEIIVEGIAKAFGTNCEVVLHSLEDPSRSIIKIVNGHVTGRDVGAPLTDLAVDILGEAGSLESDVVGSYFNKTSNGRLLKSVTMVLRSASGKAIGFMCINIDLSAPLANFIRDFEVTGEGFVAENVVERFPLSVDELVSKTTELVMKNINIQSEKSPSEKNKLIVQELYEKGMFNIKGVVDIVAKEMGISKYSVYNYIRDAKLQNRKVT